MLGAAGGLAGAAPRGRLRHPGAVGLRRPDRAREPALLRAHPRRAARRASTRRRGGRARRPRRPGRRHALRRRALARLARRRRCSADPELLVLDEPTVGLDPVLRRDLWATFHELADARRDAARLQPRDGRGRALRRAAADARRPDRRDRHAATSCASGPAPTTSRRRSSPSRRRHERRGSRSPPPRRVLRQLRHDRRTLALLIVVPPLLLALLRTSSTARPETFDRIGAPLVGHLPVHHRCSSSPRSRCCASARPARSSG